MIVRINTDLIDDSILLKYVEFLETLRFEVKSNLSGYSKILSCQLVIKLKNKFHSEEKTFRVKLKDKKAELFEY